MTQAEIISAIESNEASIAKAEAYLRGHVIASNWTEDGARRTIAGATKCNHNLQLLKPDDEPEPQDEPVDWDLIDQAKQIWTERCNRGEGYAVGDDSAGIRGLNSELGRLVWDAPYEGGPVVYRSAEGAYVAVCDANGPWAVTLREGGAV